MEKHICGQQEFCGRGRLWKTERSGCLLFQAMPDLCLLTWVQLPLGEVVEVKAAASVYAFVLAIYFLPPPPFKTF